MVSIIVKDSSLCMVMCDCVMLCNSVCTHFYDYLVSMYFTCVYAHGDLVPGIKLLLQLIE